MMNLKLFIEKLVFGYKRVYSGKAIPFTKFLNEKEIAFEYAAANTYVAPIKLIDRPPMEVIEERLNHILKMFNKEDLKAKKLSTIKTVTTDNITNTETQNEP